MQRMQCEVQRSSEKEAHHTKKPVQNNLTEKERDRDH